jgi:hypothetical protein
MKDKTLIQGYRYKDREKRLSVLKNNQDLQNLSEETLKSLILVEPLLILSLKSPSKDLILASLQLESDVIINLDKNLIDEDVIDAALHTDFLINLDSNGKESLSLAMKRFLKTVNSLSEKNQKSLLNFSFDDTKIIELLNDKNKIVFIQSWPQRFSLIKNINFNLAKVGVKKDYNNLKYCLESNQLTEVEKLELSLFALQKQPLSIRFLNMVKSKEPKQAQIELEGKIEILKLMGAS